MCQNVKYVNNKYIHRNLLVDCGKCPACQQKKAAARANRIRNTVADGNICLFVTLTYKNEFVPYIVRDDLSVGYNDVSVYRDKTCRYNRHGKGDDYSQSLDVSDGCTVGVVKDLYVHSQHQIDKLLDLNRSVSGRVGVCWFRDVQNFNKRLRQILKRNYGFKESYQSFCCSEYGSTSQRPHFHLLLFIPKDFENTFRSAIVKAWPYADSDRTAKFIEVARDCASYVSSYVNCGSDVSEILQTSSFRQKHSYSKYFGLGVKSFSLPEILKKVDESDLRYYSTVNIGGVANVVGFPIPKYVINRYFPVFKGFTRIAPDALDGVLLCPERLFEYKESLDYSSIDIYRIKVLLDNAFKKYNIITGNNRFDFVIDFKRVWTCRKSTVLRDSLQSVSDVNEWKSFYDNNLDLFPTFTTFGVHKGVSAPTLFSLGYNLEDFQLNPNMIESRVKETARLSSLYFAMCKQRKVTNYVMSNGLQLNV